MGVVKGFNILVEDFLQPLFNAAIAAERKKINETKSILDKLLEDKLNWFTCDNCGGKFRFDSDLKSHMKNHEN